MLKWAGTCPFNTESRRCVTAWIYWKSRNWGSNFYKMPGNFAVAQSFYCKTSRVMSFYFLCPIKIDRKPLLFEPLAKPHGNIPLNAVLYGNWGKSTLVYLFAGGFTSCSFLKRDWIHATDDKMGCSIWQTRFYRHADQWEFRSYFWWSKLSNPDEWPIRGQPDIAS